MAGRNGASLRATALNCGLVDRRLHGYRLEPLAARGQKARRLQAVQHAVVEREAEIHHRLDRDHAGDGHGPLEPPRLMSRCTMSSVSLNVELTSGCPRRAEIVPAMTYGR